MSTKVACIISFVPSVVRKEMKGPLKLEFRRKSAVRAAVQNSNLQSPQLAALGKANTKEQNWSLTLCGLLAHQCLIPAS